MWEVVKLANYVDNPGSHDIVISVFDDHSAAVECWTEMQDLYPTLYYVVREIVENPEDFDDWDFGADSYLAQFDDDPNPYLGTYSEE